MTYNFQAKHFYNQFTAGMTTPGAAKTQHLLETLTVRPGIDLLTHKLCGRALLTPLYLLISK